MNTLHDFVSKSILDREIVKSTINSQFVKSTMRSISTFSDKITSGVYGMVPDIVKRQTASGVVFAQNALSAVSAVPRKISSGLYAVTPEFLKRNHPSVAKSITTSNGYHRNGDAAKDHENGAVVTNGYSPAMTNGVDHRRRHSDECLDKKLKSVRFQFPGSERDRVFVTGSFYDWRVQIPMSHKSSKFVAEIFLPKGRHEFKFVVNGVWKHNASYPVMNNDAGDINNYVEVL